MPVRLAIHVGPHKTGSTSVQRALAGAREELSTGGVWYPPSLPDAKWPDQHADAWILLREGREPDFDRWLGECHAEAARRGCDTLLLSSENFHVPRTWRALDRLLERWRRGGRGDTRLVYVLRDPVALAASRALSHIAGEAGFYFLHRYDLRRWAGLFTLEQARHERRFARRGARFVRLEEGPRGALAARVLTAATDRTFPGIVTGDDNATATRVGHDAVLGYGLRVMRRYADGGEVNVPAAFAEARKVLRGPGVDEALFADLVERFEAGVRREVAQGVADVARLGPLARAWRTWIHRTAAGGRPDRG